MCNNKNSHSNSNNNNSSSSNNNSNINKIIRFIQRISTNRRLLLSTERIYLLSIIKTALTELRAKQRVKEVQVMTARCRWLYRSSIVSNSFQMEAVSYLEAPERTLKLVEAILVGMPIHTIAKKL